MEEFYILNWITMIRKSGKHYVWHTETMGNCFNLLGLISSVYRDLLHWRLNQWPQNAELKLPLVHIAYKHHRIN